MIATDEQEEFEPPVYRMQTNKVAEVRELFGPALYHWEDSNPNEWKIDPDSLGEE